MATRSTGPIRGIRNCAACGLPETLYGYQVKNICQCGISNARFAPRDPEAPKFASWMFQENPHAATPRWRK